MITTKSESPARLEAVIDFKEDRHLRKVPARFTNYLEIVIGVTHNDWVQVFRGLSLKWRVTRPTFVGLAATNPDGTLMLERPTLRSKQSLEKTSI